MQEDLNRILGTSKTTFKKIEEGFKAHVPQLTINQMGNLKFHNYDHVSHKVK